MASTPVPTQVLTGPYQLEIRRGAEYGLSDNGSLGGVNGQNGQTPILLLDTNDRLIPDHADRAPRFRCENFETQNFTKLPWNFTDDAPWTISTSADLPVDLVNPNGGSFSAVSGAITNGKSSGLSLDIITGNGNLTFGRAVSSEAAIGQPGDANFDPGDTLRLYIDGRLAKVTQVNGVLLSQPGNAEWSGDVPYQVITVPVSAGHHSFRWTYDKNTSDPPPPDPTDPNAPPARSTGRLSTTFNFPRPRSAFKTSMKTSNCTTRTTRTRLRPPLGRRCRRQPPSPRS